MATNILNTDDLEMTKMGHHWLFFLMSENSN